MRRRALVLAITAWGAQAAAHVQPSVDDNNRYLKVTPAADRVRLAYTVFFGERPGAALRPTLDHDRDGRISDAESAAFGAKVAAEVAAGLTITVDGQPQPVRWSTIAVGLNTPTVTGGAFAVDLVAWPCLPTPRGAHEIRIRDAFRVPRPGETEVRVEDGPGITLDRARIGRAVPADGSTQWAFVGPGGPLTDDGLDLAFTAAPTAPLTADATCAAPASAAPPRGPARALIVGAAAVLGLLLAAAVTWRRRRR